MTINRADVVKAKLFKHGGRHHHALGMLFKALGQLKQRWRAFQNIFTHVLSR